MSKTRNYTWMPLYVADYLADTMHLTGPEHGAYMLLLMHSWRTGPLPDDDRALAVIARTDAAAWRRMAPTIRAFFVAQDGRLSQGRMERIRAEQSAKSEQRKAAGRASAEARKGQREVNDRSTTVDHPLPISCQQTGREIEREKEEERTVPSERPVEASPSPAVRPPPDARSALWSEGLARLSRITGKPDRQSRALLGQLCRAANDDCALIGSLLHEAEAARVGDPIPWLQAAIRTRTGARASSKPQLAPDKWANLAMDWGIPADDAPDSEPELIPAVRFS